MIRFLFLILFLALCIAAAFDDWKDRRVNKRLAYLTVAVGSFAVLLNTPTLSVYYVIASVVFVFAAHLANVWYPFDSVICLLMMFLICCTPFPIYAIVVPIIPLSVIVIVKILKKGAVPIIPVLMIGFLMSVFGMLLETF